MNEDKIKQLVDEYGEACREHERAVINEKGFVMAAEKVYMVHQLLMKELGLEDKGVPPYSLNVQPWEKQFGL